MCKRLGRWRETYLGNSTDAFDGAKRSPCVAGGKLKIRSMGMDIDSVT